MTLSETNNDYFSIEFSYDLIEFNTLIDEIEGKGTSYEVNSYTESRMVNFSEEIVYFRLKQTDYNGDYSYSSLQSVFINVTENSSVFVYPNPAKSILTIELVDKETVFNSFIIDPMGFEKLMEFEITNGEKVIDVDSLKDGVYFLHINGSNESPIKIVVQH